MLLSDLKKARDAGVGETLDVLGPRIRFLTPLSDKDDEYCLIAGSLSASAVVPVHAHAERETFYLVDGEMQALWENRWTTLSSGEVFDAPGGIKHAWRNVSGAPASLLIVTPMRLARFLRDIGGPLATAERGPPTPAELQRFVDIAHAYGYWLGSPADNAAVGISLG